MMKVIFPYCLTFFLALFASHLSHAQLPTDEVVFSDHKSIPGYNTKKRKNPPFFQGNKKKKNYFEGWYFKMVSADGSSILSVIPGISLSENGEEQHAFIQMIDGTTAQTDYYRFPIEAFSFSKEKFAVRIGDNYFSEDSIVLNIHNDSTNIQGTIRMSNQVHLSEKRNEAIMGWYRFVPFMQCYHGVVSLNHNLSGELKKNDATYAFDQGLGYIEKDWGSSMPSAWIWLQTNNFSTANTSFMLSVANVPWLGSSFPGFLGFFLHNGTVHRFATYTNAKLHLEPNASDTIRITIKEKLYTYKLETYRSKSGILKAPVQGSMDRRISESIDAKLVLTVLDKEGNVIFSDSTSITGLETVGDFQALGGKEKKKSALRQAQ